ncbi:MAG: hypothetical protein M3320_09265 [Actinomycetota bacterium]|nr:hypothetical protein [Actinomycetota bacterium]MDQ5808851.1 hypothetical protein [Actinomycetota bacterium]
MHRTERVDSRATSDPAVSEAQLLTYTQLYQLWERQQWATQDLDFSRDREQWHEQVSAEERYIMRAAPTEEMRIFLGTQIADEARHVAFFDRFSSEVGVLESDNLQDRLAETSEHLNENFGVEAITIYPGGLRPPTAGRFAGRPTPQLQRACSPS